MASVKTTQRLNVGYARTRIARGSGMLRYLELRGQAVRSAAKERLRQSPRRIDTGNLLNSIQTRVFFRNNLPVVRIGTDVEYAVYVHQGTVYMEANPFLRDGLIRGLRQFLY